MPNSELLLAFFLATLMFAYMPGPSTLYATAQTLALGQRGGLSAAMGLHVGGYVHVIAAALGLATVFEIIPILYSVMKLAGAAYLVWLGFKLVLKRRPLLEDVDVPNQQVTFRQSATVEVLNPKTALFYVAFLPQFSDVDAALPVWTQLLVLGVIVNVVFSVADLTYVFLAEKISSTLKRSESFGKAATRVGGGLLIALGVNLATSR